MATAAVLALVLVVAGTFGWAVRDRETHAQVADRESAAREATIQAEVILALNEAERRQEQAK